MRLCVIGAGGWGTALSILLAGKYTEVALWVRNAGLYRDMALRRVNDLYLPQVKLPKNIRPTTDLAEAVRGKKIAVMAVPSHGLRAVAASLRNMLSPQTIVINTAKGLEQETGLRLSQVLEQELPKVNVRKIAVISGPNHAEEIARDMPAATVAASLHREVAAEVQEIFMTPNFRVYTNSDLAGVELGGSLKNVIALGAGILDGLGLGENTKAALITRGIVEITRLGTALGAKPGTFTGLSGLGDLFVTCSSEHSRNRAVGVKLGEGRPLKEILQSMQMVAEGVKTTGVAWRLSREAGVEMPITDEIYRVLYQNKPARAAVETLMQRNRKAENEDIAFLQ